MNNEQIRNLVRELHKEIWTKQKQLWPDKQMTPLQMLSPAKAAELYGVSYTEVDDLGCGNFPYGISNMRVAGLLHRTAKKIIVSTMFPIETVRYTAAHEIAHWLLHPNEIAHRDRPIDGSNKSGEIRPAIEQEADYFAACFLMPENLLIAQFKQLFGKVPFIFNEASAFHLGGNDIDTLLFASNNSLDREFALARCGSYQGKQFHSLAKQFRVSDSAMAIRLKELKLIRWP
ncbi:MAG: ImmA/IrrE family metallo-endopeptidase [Candidatus Nitrotoga sp.]